MCKTFRRYNRKMIKAKSVKIFLRIEERKEKKEKEKEERKIDKKEKEERKEIKK